MVCLLFRAPRVHLEDTNSIYPRATPPTHLSVTQLTSLGSHPSPCLLNLDFPIRPSYPDECADRGRIYQGYCQSHPEAREAKTKVEGKYERQRDTEKIIRTMNRKKFREVKNDRCTHQSIAKLSVERIRKLLTSNSIMHLPIAFPLPEGSQPQPHSFHQILGKAQQEVGWMQPVKPLPDHC